MTEPLLEVQLAAYLNAQGFGNLGTEDITPRVIFTGEVPEQEEGRLIVLQEGGGEPPPNKFAQERQITILVYDENYVDGRTVAQQIQRILHENQGILEPEILVARIVAESNPIPLGRDANNRHIFSQGFALLVKNLEPT